MSISAFPALKRLRPARTKTKDITLRDFSGGLKINESQSKMRSKYATQLVNLIPDTDTSQTVRFGTKLFVTATSAILGMRYFRDHIIVVLVDGTIEKVNNVGTKENIWTGEWSNGLEQVDFTEFRGGLVIVNGEDKPVIVDEDLTVDYLQDLGTGSNVNTPITRLVTTVNEYVVMAGQPDAETTIYISSTGTSGTWPGDPDPNEAASFDVGAHVGHSSTRIYAIASFKTYLLVYFESFLAVFQLGVFNDANVHDPELIDTFADIGTINHKTLIETDTNVVYPSNIGVISASRNVFGGTLGSDTMTEDIATFYNKMVGTVAGNNLDCYCINDTISKTIFFSFKQIDGTIKGLAMKYTKNFSGYAWAVIEGWDFTAACRSEKGRVFFAKDNEIYQYGNASFEDEDYSADFITDESDGIAIDFDWEFPWLDGKERAKTKVLKKVTFDTTGKAAFTLQCFVDKFYKDAEGELTPALEMDFVAGDTTGYGFSTGFYGGGRRANDERFYGMPAKFKILKMRLSGATKEPLKFVSITVLFSIGNYNR